MAANIGLIGQLALAEQKILSLESDKASAEKSILRLEKDKTLAKKQISSLENAKTVSEQHISRLESLLKKADDRVSSLQNGKRSLEVSDGRCGGGWYSWFFVWLIGELGFLCHPQVYTVG